MATASEVRAIIASQQAYANSAIASADGFLQRLEDIADGSFIVIPGVGAPDFTWDSSEETQALLLSLLPGAPEFTSISAIAPTYTPTTIENIDPVLVPDFTGVAPVLDFPTVPSSVLPVAPSSPSISDPVLPTAPVVALPTAPTVGAITLPEPPSIEIPSFTTTLPVDDLVVPTNSFEFYEELYTSALLSELQAKLLYDLQNGGYGIEPDDEAALFERARSRELELAASEMETLLVDSAARGFPLPPGDLNVALQRAHQNLQDKVSTLSRDIMLKRADLYVDNRRFTIEQTRQLEQILIGFHNSRMERSLNAAKAILDAAIKVYEAQVSRYTARLDAYKTEAQVFEARVRAQLAQVEIFKVVMEGKRLEVDVQRAAVEVYNAQLSGINTVVGIYKTQMEAAQVQAGIERLRIEAFRALIEGYTSQVQAKVAEFNMYEAQIRGQVARTQAYESEVKAYTATVEGAKAKADILIARLRAAIDVGNQQIEVFKAQIQAYQSDIDAQAKTIDAQTRIYGSQIQGFTAQTSAIAEAHRLDLTARQIQAQVNMKNAEIGVEQAKVLLASLQQSAAINVSAGDAASRHYSALIGSALQSIGTLASATSTTG